MLYMQIIIKLHNQNGLASPEKYETRLAHLDYEKLYSSADTILLIYSTFMIQFCEREKKCYSYYSIAPIKKFLG